MQIVGSPQAEIPKKKGVSLCSFLLLISGRRRYCRVEGSSMIPTIHHGDFVIYKPIKIEKHKPLEGKIVVAKNPIKSKVLVIKRIYKASSKGFELRGDNYWHSIDSRRYGIVKPSNLCGIVEQIVSFRND